MRARSEMQTLTILLAPNTLYYATKGKRDDDNTYIKFYSNIHTWRMESYKGDYGIWWKRINSSDEFWISFTQISCMDLAESKD
jgi:hypothetical protein